MQNRLWACYIVLAALAVTPPCCRAELEDELTLEACSIAAGSTLRLELRLRGD